MRENECEVSFISVSEWVVKLYNFCNSFHGVTKVRGQLFFSDSELGASSLK